MLTHCVRYGELLADFEINNNIRHLHINFVQSFFESLHFRSRNTVEEKRLKVLNWKVRSEVAGLVLV